MAIGTWTPAFAWRYGGGNNKTILEQQGVLTIITGASGAAPGELPAASFGLNTILGAPQISLTDNSKMYFGVPDNLGTSLLTNGANATNAPVGLPIGSYNVIIRGFSA